MNPKISVTLHYFLRKLEKIVSVEPQEKVNPFFLQLFTKEELLEILNWLSHGNNPHTEAQSEMSSEQLLEVIGNEKHILRYIMQLWDTEKEHQSIVDITNVNSTLAQLGLQTHYLADKPISNWDPYDRNNFGALLQKAGKFRPRFGLFDANVKEEDKYSCTTPAKRYQTQWEAQMMLALLIAEGEFCEGELKIMPL